MYIYMYMLLYNFLFFINNVLILREHVHVTRYMYMFIGRRVSCVTSVLLVYTVGVPKDEFTKMVQHSEIPDSERYGIY